MPLRRLLLALLGAALVIAPVSAGPAAAHQRSEPRPVVTFSIPGDAVFPEGVAADPRNGDFYVGSTTDGTIFRGNVRRPALEVFLAGGTDGRTSATGTRAGACSCPAGAPARCGSTSCAAVGSSATSTPARAPPASSTTSP